MTQIRNISIHVIYAYLRLKKQWLSLNILFEWKFGLTYS